MQTINIPEIVKPAFVKILNEEKSRLQGMIKEIDNILSEMQNGSSKVAKDKKYISVATTSKDGGEAWHQKIEKVLLKDTKGEMGATQINKAICEEYPGTNARVAEKSISSTLSQFTKPEKAKFLVDKTRKPFIYRLNKSYVK